LGCILYGKVKIPSSPGAELNDEELPRCERSKPQKRFLAGQNEPRPFSLHMPGAQKSFLPMSN
jgi:hypothetical protein